MSKTGKTKTEILKLISKSQKTLTEISGELGLAPSTVSQHLQELQNEGRIEQIENPHIRKWKYYRLAEGQMAAASGNRNAVYYTMGAIAVIAVAAVILFSLHSSILPSQNYVPISLTDPPHVPAGTQALYINYSGIELHISGNGPTDGWISSNSSGSIDLMSLINISKTIGGANVPSGSVIDMASFNITSATIEINNTMYAVRVPYGRILANISGANSQNDSIGILLDLSPTIASIYGQNSTTFVLVPSLGAVAVPKYNSSAFVGSERSMGPGEWQQLFTAEPKIRITNATLIAAQNFTDIRITVENYGNRSVALDHLLLYGFNGSQFIVSNSTGNWSSDRRPIGGFNASQSQETGRHGRTGSRSYAVGPAGAGGQWQAGLNGPGSSQQQMHPIPGMPGMMDIKSLKMTSFLIEDNGTLVLPSLQTAYGQGYSLQPNSSITFMFDGNIASPNGHMQASLKSGTEYRIVVVGPDCALATANATAEQGQ